VTTAANGSGAPWSLYHWSEIDADSRRRILERSTRQIFEPSLRADVEKIVADVREHGDVAVSRALAQFDHCEVAPGDLAVTPDGPRGPRCIAHPGVVELAKLTGLPIIPLTFAASKKNSSGAGTGFRSRCRSAGPAGRGASRSGCRATRTACNLNQSGWKWRPPSTSSVTRRITRSAGEQRAGA